MKERNVEQKGPRRSEWLFSYTVGSIHEAAKNKVKYHDARIKFWRKEQDTVEKEVKSASVTTTRYAVTGGEDIIVQVDPKLNNRLNQCNGKIREHQAKRKEFAQWVEVLGTQPKTTAVDLSMDDALYFNMAARAEEE